MITISTKQTVRALRAIGHELSEREFRTALYRSLNESILLGRTEARKAVKDTYNIPQRYLAGINVFKASSVSLASKLYASANPIPMDAFNAKFETSSSAIRISKKGEQKIRNFKRAKKAPLGGVSIEVIKGQRQTVPYAFMIAGAKPRVFARGEYRNGTAYGFIQRHHRVNSGSDTPIKPLISVTVHAAVINKEALGKIERRVTQAFPVALDRNVAFMLDKAAAAISVQGGAV
jgi:hypothetical protein